MNGNENITTRIDPKFKKELEHIKNKRIEKGLDDSKKSDRILTRVIVRHNSWETIREEIINADNEEFEK